MNLFWLIRYLGISFECVGPILKAIWLTSDRLQHEFDLLLIPIDIQLGEWGYDKELQHLDRWQPYWRATRVGLPGVFCGIKLNRITFFINGNSANFTVTFQKPSNQYFRERGEAVQIFPDRNAWLEHFLCEVGPKKAGRKAISAGSWTRCKGTWRCSP